MTRARVSSEQIQLWGPDVCRRLKPAIVRVYADGSIEFNADHPAWKRESFKRHQVPEDRK